MRTPRGLLPYLPAALLCLVAILQVHLTRSQLLSPWKGGGFGMFSTLDDLRSVRVRAFGREDTTRLADLEKSSQGERAAILPSDRALRNLAREAARAQQRAHVEFRAIEVQVWKKTYDARTLAPDSVLLRDVTIQADSSR